MKQPEILWRRETLLQEDSAFFSLFGLPEKKHAHRLVGVSLCLNIRLGLLAAGTQHDLDRFPHLASQVKLFHVHRQALERGHGKVGA